jgi:peptide/nickel transport system permease protein
VRRRYPKKFIFAFITIGVAIICALLAPWLAPNDPVKADLTVRLIPPFFQKGGNWNHPLGTDHIGRDVLSRIIYGARISLAVGFTSTFVGLIIGGLLGLLSGYFGGKTDSLITKLMDIQLSFPFILFAIFVAGILGPNLINVIIICGVTRWVVFARVIRGEVLSIREKEFIEAARGIGCSVPRILVRHVFPNIISSVLVLATLNLGTIIVLESTLSFLGLGVQPPSPSWGNMLNDGKAYMVQAWWITALPGIAIMLVVLSANMIGDYLSDLMNPYAKQLMGTLEK